MVKEQNNNIPPQESLFSRNVDESASGEFGLDWSDAIASGYLVEFNATSSSIQIPVGKSFVIDPTTVSTVPLQVSPSTSESSEGERRVVRIGSELFAFYYDGSNILYRTSTDDGYTWSSATSLGTGVVASDYHRWAVSTTSISGNNYISVLYWVPNGGNMDFKALRGTVTASSVTWSNHILLGYTWANSGACGSGGACAAAVANTDTQGNIFASFTWLSGGATQYSYQIMKSTDGGLNWATSLSQVYPVSISKPTMAITTLDSGKILFAYTNYDSSDFKYRVYNGATWENEQTTPTGSGMSTSTLKQISAASNSTNFGFIAYVTGGTSGTLKVARFSNTGTFQAYETANSTLSHSLPSIVIPPNGADSIIRIYTISGGKVYETKNDGTWQNSFNPFGTSFTSLNQLTAAANDPSALWIENSANPYNLRFGRDMPVITWTPVSGSVWAVPDLAQQLNYTSDITFNYADVIISSVVSNYTTSQEGVSYIPAGQMQALGVRLGIPPDGTSGWHNGTVSFMTSGGSLVNSYPINIKVPTISKATVQVQGGTIDYIMTPATGSIFTDTVDVASFMTFTNGTRKLIHVDYDVRPAPEEFGSFSAMAILTPLTAAYDWLAGAFDFLAPRSSFFNDHIAYAQQPDPCTSYGFRYDYKKYGGANGANIDDDLRVAKDTVGSNSSSPLIVRMDIRWKDIDTGSFDSNGNWVPQYTSTNDALFIDDIFNKVVNSPDEKAMIILGTHEPPAAIRNDTSVGIGNTITSSVLGTTAVQFLPKYRADANSFVQHVVDHINSNSTMSNSVQYWQIDNEPDTHTPIIITNPLGLPAPRPDYVTLASALNEWLNIAKQADWSKKTVLNMYQSNTNLASIGVNTLFQGRTIVPYDNLLQADTQLGQQIVSKLDVMGFDIYPDQLFFIDDDSDHIDNFNDSLELAGNQFNNAKSQFSFAGNWGIIEMAAGPKDDQGGFNLPPPIPNAVGQEALNAKNAAFGTPELIVFFQLRAANMPESVPWNESYGLINHTLSAVNVSFQDEIQENVVQNCPVFPVTHMLDTTASTGLTTYSGRQSHVELVTSSSQLVGDKIDQITARLSKTGSPTGTVQIGVFNSDRSVKQLFGSMSAASLTTSYTDYTFSLTGGQLYTIAPSDRIGIKFTGGSSSNAVRIMTDNNSADPFDGSNSYRQHYTTSWQTFTSEDLYMTLRQTHG